MLGGGLRSVLLGLGVVALGSGAGVAGSLWVGQWQATESGSPHHGEHINTESVSMLELKDRMDALEKREPTVAPRPALPERDDEQNGTDDLERDEDHVRMSPAEVEESRRRRTEDFESRCAALRSEPVDSEWASGVAATIEEGLLSLAQNLAFEPVSVDCRTSGCVILTQWRSYDEARAGYEALLHQSFGLSECSREIIMPLPDEMDDIYVVTMLASCP